MSIAVRESEGMTLGDNGKFHSNEPVMIAQFVTFLYHVMQFQGITCVRE